ncbi:MFS transporter [Nocardioides sp. dk4132]|nr:MFS transporter [Nocardioides sp. dk4132]QGA09490.1 MFS transporter [Nocardioides sp. dk884]
MAPEEDIARHTSPGRARLEVALIGGASLTVALTQTVLVPLLGVLPAQLDATASEVTWLLTVTLIASAVSIPLFGRLGDMFGKRRMLLISIAILVAGSVLGALAGDNLAVLLVARAIQGAAGATISLGISLCAALLPHDKRPGAMAFISATIGIGSALGMPLGGIFGEHSDFHHLFWIAAAVGALSFVGILLVVPEAPSRTGGRVHVMGVVTLSGALVTLLLPLAQAPTWGWGDPWTIGLLLVSAALTTVFVRSQRRVTDPLVDLVALRRKPIVLTNLSSLLFGAALFASLIATTTYVEAPEATGYGFGASTMGGALTMLPMAIAMLLLTPLSARLIIGWGAHYTLALGAGIVALGWLARVFFSAEIWMIAAATGVIGAGTAIAYAAMPALITANTPSSEIAAANGLNTLFRALGSSLASAAGSTILAMQVIDIDGHEMPEWTAFRTLFWICFGASVLALLVALRIPRQADPRAL